MEDNKTRVKLVVYIISLGILLWAASIAYFVDAVHGLELINPNGWKVVKSDYIMGDIDFDMERVNDTSYLVRWKWKDDLSRALFKDEVSYKTDQEFIEYYSGKTGIPQQTRDILQYLTSVNTSIEGNRPKELYKTRTSASLKQERYKTSGIKYNLDRDYLKIHKVPHEMLHGNARVQGDVNIEDMNGSFYIDMVGEYPWFQPATFKFGMGTLIQEFNNSDATDNVTFTDNVTQTLYLNISLMAVVNGSNLTLKGYPIDNTNGGYEEYAVWIKADSLTCGAFTNANVTCSEIYDDLYKINSSVGTYQFNRGQVHKSIWEDGQTSAIIASASNVEWVVVNTSDETDYRVYYFYGERSQGCSNCGCAYDYINGTFDIVLDNDVSSWTNIYGYYDNQGGEWSVGGSPLVDFYGTTGQHNLEIGTDTSADDQSDPADFEFVLQAGCSPGTGQVVAEVILWTQSSATLDMGDTEYDFYTDGNIPLTELNKPSNVTLTVGGTPVWNKTGYFDTTEYTDGLEDAINDAINSGLCNCAGCIKKLNTCLVPFTLYSDTPGKIEYSSLEIDYNVYNTSLVVYFRDELDNDIITTENITLVIEGQDDDYSQSETTDDGSVSFINLTFQEYKLTASGDSYYQTVIYHNLSVIGNVTMYLFNDSDRLNYVEFYVIDRSGDPIENALLEFSFTNDTTVIKSARTDSFGYCQVVLDSLGEYNLNVTHSDYIDRYLTIQPYRTSYTWIMDSEGGSQYYNVYQGIKYTIIPSGTILNQTDGTYTDIRMVLSDSTGTLEEYGIVLSNISYSCVPANCLHNRSDLYGGEVKVKVLNNESGRFKATFYFDRTGEDRVNLQNVWYVTDNSTLYNVSFMSASNEFRDSLGSTVMLSFVAMVVIAIGVVTAVQFGIVGFPLILVTALVETGLIFLGYISKIVGLISIIWGVLLYVFLARNE